MKLEGAIFDMDGTLVDSMGYWRELSREYLMARGIPEPDPAVLERTKPLTVLETASLFLRAYPQLPGTPESIAAEVNGIMEAHYRSDVPLKPGVRTCLERLRALGVPICVASATAKPLMEACLERLGVLDEMEFLLSCEEVGVGKSRPDVYFAAARRLGAVPARTLVAEDSLHAAQTAKRAGFLVAGVYDPAAEEDRAELESLCDWYLLRPDEEGFLSQFTRA